MIQIIYSHFRIEYHHRVSNQQKDFWPLLTRDTKKALPLTQFLKENEMGKLVAPFMLNMGVDIICNEILKISQQTFITDPMRRCNISICIYM